MRRNMNRKWFSILKILVIFLVVGKTSLGQECDSNEISCISCTEYKVCNVGVPEGRIISCKSGNSCADNRLIECQMKLNCYELNECTENGIFPNSMSDSDYFVCLSDGGDGFLKYEFKCQEEYFFDDSILSCIPRSVTASDLEDPTSSPTSTDLTSSIPTSSDPTSSTSTSADPSSSASTDPTSSTSTSADPSSSSSSTDPTSTSTSTSINPTSPSTSPSIPTEPTTPTEAPPFACAGPGIFPNPNNCKMYYRCSTSLKAFFYICPGSSYFNENILKCSLIITPACQEQITKNSTVSSTTPKATTTSTTSTTPKPSTTTTSTTSTTTTPIPTTTSSISTVTPTTSGPFTCPTAGTFEDPSDCKTYYRCSTSGKIFRYVCPGNSYFNEFTKRCSLAMTPRCKNLTQG